MGSALLRNKQPPYLDYMQLSVRQTTSHACLLHNTKPHSVVPRPIRLLSQRICDTVPHPWWYRHTCWEDRASVATCKYVLHSDTKDQVLKIIVVCVLHNCVVVLASHNLFNLLVCCLCLHGDHSHVMYHWAHKLWFSSTLGTSGWQAPLALNSV